MNKEEYDHKIAEIKANHTPAQARAAKLIKPLFLSIAALFLLLFIALIIDAANEPKAIVSAEVSAPSLETIAADNIEFAKWQALQGVSDCQLALSVYNDYQPIFAELHQYLTKANLPTYEELYNWKQLTRLDERIEELDNKYPQSYKVSMQNVLFAKNLGFAIGQYWRDAHSSMRRTNNQGPIGSEQPSLMNDDLQLLKQNCPEEFKGMK